MVHSSGRRSAVLDIGTVSIFKHQVYAFVSFHSDPWLRTGYWLVAHTFRFPFHGKGY